MACSRRSASSGPRALTVDQYQRRSRASVGGSAAGVVLGQTAIRVGGDPGVQGAIAAPGDIDGPGHVPMSSPLPPARSPSLSSAGPHTHRDPRYDGTPRSVGTGRSSDGAGPAPAREEHSSGSTDSAHLAIRGPSGARDGRPARGRLVWTERPQESFIVSVAVVFALVFTGYGAGTVFLLRRKPGNAFFLIQALVDLGLVTTVLHFAGQPQSAFPALYVLVVAAYCAAHAAGLGGADRRPRVGPFCGRHPLDPWRLPGYARPGPRSSSSTWSSASWPSWATACARPGWSTPPWPPSCSGSGWRPMTFSGTSGPACSRSMASGRLAFINPTAERLLDLDGEALIGLPVLDHLKTRSSELWAAAVAGIRNGRKISRGEGMVVQGGGRMFPIGLSTTTFRQEAQEAPSVTAIFTDISDLKEVQELHMRAERLEAVAELSASLAHEIRNPLASIRSSVEQLARSKHADEDERFLAGLIVRESDRLSRLLSEFLDFARVRATQFVPLDLHSVVVAVVRLIRAHPDCRPDAAITVEGEHTILEGDEDLLHRVIANLVLNAVQAARGPIRITVGGGARFRPRIFLTGPIWSTPCGYRSGTTGPAYPRKCASGCFSRSYPAGPAAAGWDWPSFSAPSRRIGGWCWSIPAPAPEPHSPFSCPPRW